MLSATLIVFLAGALMAGLVTGLTGFGTALVVSAFWLHFMDPIAVAPLAAICSVTGQLVSLRSTWRGFQWRAVTPYIIGALVGLPIGSWLLDYFDADIAKVTIGAFLVLFALYSLILRTPPKIQVESRPGDGAVGFVGGVMGGMAGLSGIAPMIWCQLRNVSKTVQRGIYQPFNMTILFIAVLLHAWNGRINEEVGQAFLVAMPATFVGAWLGTMLYHRLDDVLFKKVVLILLLMSGIGLLVRYIFG